MFDGKKTGRMRVPDEQFRCDPELQSRVASRAKSFKRSIPNEMMDLFEVAFKCLDGLCCHALAQHGAKEEQSEKEPVTQRREMAQVGAQEPLFPGPRAVRPNTARKRVHG